MKKKVIVFTVLSIAAAILIAVVIDRQTPTGSDFAAWMENTYAVECQNESCGVFEIETESGETVVLQTASGTYSPGPFVLDVNRVYLSFDDYAYRLEIHVKGFMDQFSLEKEVLRNIEKNES
ncbi:hypothetical protein JMA_03010 [Jeotgalibacillus malaysiensis]|uniref:Uncharacterized protein n=1 Tax=Jeotgalibacillus malaysiensis TaxID=1508404 RepID=A0A0B5AM31_9BACL|nr:hypothetical protein [Jeotgalibacillus malaysiensis]AJD89618.1 hypothetical protein JMA_03010 [Jeotgalibacillus malaysiensis]